MVVDIHYFGSLFLSSFDSFDLQILLTPAETCFAGILEAVPFAVVLRAISQPFEMFADDCIASDDWTLNRAPRIEYKLLHLVRR